jgi:polyisoprenoid-binding protein YceI
MKKIKLVFAIVLIIAASSFVAYKAINWKVKDDYAISVYQGGNKFIMFKGLKAEIILDEERIENSKISATINSDVILVEPNQALERDAEGIDVLDIQNYPIITFISTSVNKQGDSYETIGKLTIKNVSKEIKLPFTFKNEILKGAFTINLSDFNINHQGFNKQLQVVLNVPVTK